MTRRHLFLALVLLASMLAGCASPSEPRPGPVADDGPEEDPTERGDGEVLLSLARQGASWLDTPEKARLAGYEPSSYCVPGHGVRWLDGDAVDTHVDPLHPEIVRFLPTTEDTGDESRQRFIGVEYVLVTEGTEMNSTSDPPRVEGVEMRGPFPPNAPGAPWHTVLSVTLAEDLAGEDPFSPDPRAIACPPNTTAPGVETPPAARELPSEDPIDARTLPACEAMRPQSVHHHAELFVYLENASEPVDLSPERYQLAANQVHVEWGARDAGGATVHVHAAGTTIGCFMATLGWQVADDAIVTDTGGVYQEDADRRLEVYVDGERAWSGLDTEMLHEKRYVVRYADASAGSGA